jgi:small-conductance mechanosensitive channel
MDNFNLSNISIHFAAEVFSTLLLFMLLWMIYLLAGKLIAAKMDDPKKRYQWKRFLLYTIVAIAILMLTRIWLGVFKGMTTYLGFLSAGIAIALKDPLVNLTAWIFIIIRKPFKIGDRVQVDQIAGDVIDIRIFQFSVMEVGNRIDAEQSTGRIIHIPNQVVFTTPQVNFTAGFNYIWNEIPVLITFESNWKKAKGILEKIIEKDSLFLNEEAERQIKQAAKKFMIFYTKLTPIVYVSVKDSGILLTIRYLCKVREKRSTEDIVWKDVLNEFADARDIDFAYPTQRFFNNTIEGKQSGK